MTTEQGNIAIAEWMGYKPLLDLMSKKNGLNQLTTMAYSWEPMTNYHSDLNAMHEAEEAIREWNYREAYLNQLDEVVFNTLGQTERVCRWRFAHATAPQRWEALLRTLNLWKD